jgi:hypothetical protein
MTELVSRVDPPQLCGNCGMKHYPGEPGFDAGCPQWIPEGAPIDPQVAREMHTALDDNPAGKTQDHFKARRVLFEQVSRQIRAVVKDLLPAVTREFKQQLDRELGLDALRKRVDAVADNVARDAESVSGSLSAQLDLRVEQLLARIEEEAGDAVVAAFTKRAQALIAKEVGAQMTRLLMQRQERPPPKVERRVRVKKKRSTRG